MARQYEIKGAFTRATARDAAGRMSVSTADFVRELAAVNHQWTRNEANNWIERYQPGWKEQSSEGENKHFLLRNMGYTV